MDAVDPPWVEARCRNSPEEPDDNDLFGSTFIGADCGMLVHDLTTIPSSGSLELLFKTDPFSKGGSWSIDLFET